MGIYAAVLHALNNLDKDLLLVAKDDELGKTTSGFEFDHKKTGTEEERLMAAKQKTIFVYDDFSSEQPVLMGDSFLCECYQRRRVLFF